MLSHLHIEHFALIEKMDIDFSARLNVLTGETGAGKSIVIDAIRFVLGERMDSIRVNVEDNACLVEAAFDTGSEKFKGNELIQSYLGAEDDLVILKREHSPQGKSKCWVNDRAVNASTLKQIGSFLIDIHGQYDHQQLLDPAWQLELLDSYGKTESEKDEYRKLFAEYRQVLEQKESLEKLKAGREREMDLLKYQIDEIERGAIEDMNEEEMEHERMKLANAEKLSEYAARISQSLDEDEKSVLSMLARIQKGITSLWKLDPSLESLKSEIENVILGAEEIARAVRNYQESLSFEPERLAEIERKSDILELLKKKYGKTVGEIKSFLISARTKYDQLLNSEVYGREIDGHLGRILPVLNRHAAALFGKRKKAAQIVKESIEKELQDLQIPYAAFECSFEKIDFTESGSDRAEFMIRINAGQPLLRLREIVSAGEVARIMLAIKKTLAAVDQVPTLIFDEIDANIGGRLGQITGRKLSEISGNHQVLLITHLPQIASFADRHFKVSKAVRRGKTVAEYKLLEGEDRVKELAQMMSGHQETEISRKHAHEMLERVSKLS